MTFFSKFAGNTAFAKLLVDSIQQQNTNKTFWHNLAETSGKEQGERTRRKKTGRGYKNTTMFRQR